jgi:hypothetical protein
VKILVNPTDSLLVGTKGNTRIESFCLIAMSANYGHKHPYLAEMDRFPRQCTLGDRERSANMGCIARVILLDGPQSKRRARFPLAGVFSSRGDV